MASLGQGKAADDIRVVAFDAYGTLFDVAAAARQAAEEPEHSVLRENWAKYRRCLAHPPVGIHVAAFPDRGP